MSYHEQDAYFAQAYRTGTDSWTTIAFNRRAKELALHLPKGAMILDVGAGRGTTLYDLASLGFKAIGLEKNTDLVAKGNAEVKVKGLEKQIRFLEGDALDVPFADQSFDAVVDIGLLHHLRQADVVTYIHEVARVLKQGGYFFLIALSKKTPKYFNWHPCTDTICDFTKDGVGYHFFSDEELQGVLGRDFRIEDISYDLPKGSDGMFAVVLARKK